MAGADVKHKSTSHARAKPASKKISPQALTTSKAELDALQQKINTLEAELASTETSRQDASDELKASEQAISIANRTLADLADAEDAATDRLQQIAQQMSRLQARIALQRRALASKLKAQYQHGNSDTLRLLLSSEDPNTLARDLAYLRYISHAHQVQVSQLQADVATLNQAAQAAEKTKSQLTAIANQRRHEKAALEIQKSTRATALAKISAQLASQKKQVEKMKRDESRLTQLIDKLNLMLAEQAKLREAQAQDAALKARQAALKARADATNKPVPLKPNTKVTDTPPPKNKPITITPSNPVSQPKVAGDARALKGKLSPPVAGSPNNQFGAARPDSGVAWRGWVYPVPNGTEVKSVAAGQIVYADWLRGFGNMVIIDHGGGLMSIYGSLESALKHVGERVNAGQVIGRSGDSGGSDAGLYFELRYQGKAFDPTGWLR